VNKELPPRLLKRHLTFCKDNKLAEAKAIALSTCLTSKSSHTINMALDYLFELFGETFVLDNLLKSADDTLLLEIGNKCSNAADGKLEAKLLEKVAVAASPLEFLPALIRLQSYDGLKTYLEIAKGANSIPDYNGSPVHHLTELIEYINKIELLPVLIELVTLRFQHGFKDGDFRSLYTALFNALARIAKEGHFDEVITHTTKLLGEQPNNLDLKRFCNTLVDEIKRQESINTSKSWTIDEIKKLSPLQ